MATSKSIASFDVSTLLAKARNQFRDLDPKDPAAWPFAPRYALYIAIAFLVFAGLWFFWLDGVNEDLDIEHAKEVSLKLDYQNKLGKTANLDLLKKQREQVQQYVTLLEKQLPSKAEMDALLSDINQAGLGRSLQFELFRPGQVSVKDYYAELPIALRVTGRYHDIGAFAADIANLSRIVTLNNISVIPQKDGLLTMEATAKTFRYLDVQEQEMQKKTAVSKASVK
jgi:type IV pilus assembly protein PilO